MEPLPTGQENPQDKQPNRLVQLMTALLSRILKRDSAFEQVRLNQEVESPHVQTFKQLVEGIHRGYQSSDFSPLDDIYLIDEREGSEIEIPARELWQRGIENIQTGRILVLPSSQLLGIVKVDAHDVCVSPDPDTRFYINFTGRKAPARKGQAIPIIIVDTHPLLLDAGDLKTNGGSLQVEKSDLDQIVLSVLQAQVCMEQAEERGEFIVDESTYRQAKISFARPRKGWQES